MRLALAAHDEVLREAIEAHGGSLFKHTGDGVCAAFASPRSAVDAAVAAQRALELPVRMGLATGEAEVRGLIDAAEASHNPNVLSQALLAYGYVFRDADPGRALEALRRGLVIAQDSGNRLWETQLAFMLSGLEAEHGDRMAALDYLTVAIRNHHESGNTGMMRNPLAVLATFLDRLGRYEAAATIGGFATVDPMTSAALPELGTAITHLREVLGDQTYESLARKGEAMSTAAVATYAYDQIDQARTELEHPS
jgi:hypothetical protein